MLVKAFRLFLLLLGAIMNYKKEGAVLFGTSVFVYPEDISKAEQCLIDNGIEQGEAKTVLQAIGYILLNLELYPENKELCANEQ